MTATEAHHAPAGSDQSRVRDQPSLTTSTGTIWLLVGGLLAVTGIAILAPMIGLGAPGAALTGIVTILLLYVAMLVVKVAAPNGRVRLGLLAVGMVAIAIVEFFCIWSITAIEWNVLS